MRKSVLCLTVLLALLGIFGNFGAAFYYKQTSNYNQDSAAAYAMNNTLEGNGLRRLADLAHSKANEVASIQRLAEVALWLIIIAAFLAVGVLSAGVIYSTIVMIFRTKSDVDTSQRVEDLAETIISHAKSLHRKIVAMFVFVSLALLVRSFFTIFYGMAQAFQDFGVLCAKSRCDPCHNIYSHIQGWLVYTPSFQMTSLLISSPLALLVGFWGLADPINSNVNSNSGRTLGVDIGL